jgi:hypothetical protein
MFDFSRVYFSAAQEGFAVSDLPLMKDYFSIKIRFRILDNDTGVIPKKFAM